ncbi:GNAT family N-acetyltransferase [Aquibacillus koreensis]|uniref:GNAT family N-acetyltransferase n=1 Tax=Aquibacillus koreensis TaxID=279446 RepID=A0A9X3WPF2_9BACI|nr:GNAT family N-acetyltransferase [Aquibacillus koreensis]MCT2537704.1 GNAT family N-acetyltransferase [Aquibacillus koreensis]MDC3420949.1 GNAT family N-acetyltransferase [Aquibacillus koreensis]
MEWGKGEFVISDERMKIDVDAVHQLLSNTYWASKRSKEDVAKSMKHSIVFGLYEDSKQIGFARVITDKTVFSWLLDVVIDTSYRGKGLGKWLITCILEHPDIKQTRIGLATKDAHRFYEDFGFKISECMRTDQ